MRRIIPLVCVPLALTACASGADQQRTATASRTPFTQALAREYTAFSQSERNQSDWPDGRKYADKAEMAAQGRVPAPENARDFDFSSNLHPEINLGPEQQDAIVQGGDRLRQALQGGAAERNPAAAARTQVAYDCWVEQLDEGWQKDDIDRCRNAFNTGLAQLEARPVAAAPAPREPIAERFQVYFDFDSAQLSEEGRRIVAAAAQELRQAGPRQVDVVGHADRAGTDQYNQQLSEARAETVRQALLAQGVPADRIRTDAAGEADPAVPTPDNVRQPQNRRTVIDFD